jgi:hypothetical protein
MKVLTLLGWNVELDETDVSEKMKGPLHMRIFQWFMSLNFDAFSAGRISKLWAASFEDDLKPRAVPVKRH